MATASKITLKCRECPVIIKGEVTRHDQPATEPAASMPGAWTCPDCGSPMDELAAAKPESPTEAEIHAARLVLLRAKLHALEELLVLETELAELRSQNRAEGD